jgi:hypothetical protein
VFNYLFSLSVTRLVPNRIAVECGIQRRKGKKGTRGFKISDIAAVERR